ncbi:MAG: NAD(+)/NADH kinase [Saccharofermentanales bacterium]
MWNSVGIIANPRSGSDIRRLVAYGAGIDNQFKVNIIARALIALAHLGISCIQYMPDEYAIVPRALNCLTSDDRHLLDQVEVRPIDMPVQYEEADSTYCAQKMRGEVGCILVLGGDGTNRAVAKECGETPLISISTGTNNVFPDLIEGTVAGMAAALYCRLPRETAKNFICPSKRIEIFRDDKLIDIALIDLVKSENINLGSRAVWSIKEVRQIVVTSCCAWNIGMTSIPAQIQHISPRDNNGMEVMLDKEKQMFRIPFAPGLMPLVGFESHQIVSINERMEILPGPGSLALDGERLISMKKTDKLYYCITWDGPYKIDVHKLLQTCAGTKLMQTSDGSGDNLT